VTLKRFGHVYVLLALAAFGCTRTRAGNAGGMHRGNAQRTGVYDARPATAPVEALWRTAADVDVSTRAVVAGGRLYFEGTKRVLHALDATTGANLWTFGTERERGKFDFDSAEVPSVANGTLYWKTSDELVALDPVTGQGRWHVAQAGLLAPAVADGVVFAGTGGQFTAVTAATGQEKWRFNTGRDSVVFSGPVVGDGSVCFGTIGEPPSLTCVNAATGQQEWRSELAAKDGLPVALAVDGGTVFSVLLSGATPQGTSMLKAFDARTGTARWQADATLIEPVVANGCVYTAVADPQGGTKLAAIDARTGQDRWRNSLTGALAQGNNLILSGGLLYLGGDKSLIAVDAATGQEKWRFQVGEPAVPETIANNVIYFAGKGFLQAVR